MGEVNVVGGASGSSLEHIASVALMRLPGSHLRIWEAKYRVRMRDGSEGEPPSEWARYLRERVTRPGWSVVRLARESNVHRSTIFRWLKGSTTNVTAERVHRVARAFGEDPAVALLAIGDVLQAEDAELDDMDFEIQMIEDSNLSRPQKDAMIREAKRLRDRQRAERLAMQDRQVAERLEQIKTWIELAGGPQPAT